jgi:acetyl-CoA carboxylase/biotin carboxylase 1
MLRRWFVEDKGETNSFLWDQNEAVVEWFEDQKRDESIVNRNISAVRKDAIISQIQLALQVITVIFSYIKFFIQLL